MAAAQDCGVPAFRRYRRRKVEIVEPADELERPAVLDEAEELLRKENLRRDPALDQMAGAEVIDLKGHELVIGLCDRVEKFGPVARADGRPRRRRVQRRR